MQTKNTDSAIFANFNFINLSKNESRNVLQKLAQLQELDNQKTILNEITTAVAFLQNPANVSTVMNFDGSYNEQSIDRGEMLTKAYHVVKQAITPYMIKIQEGLKKLQQSGLSDNLQAAISPIMSNSSIGSLATSSQQLDAIWRGQSEKEVAEFIRQIANALPESLSALTIFIENVQHEIEEKVAQTTQNNIINSEEPGSVKENEVSQQNTATTTQTT